MREYELHPEAYTDLDEIGEYIGEHSNTDTAKGVAGEIFKAFPRWRRFPIGATAVQTLHPAPCVSGACTIT